MANCLGICVSSVLVVNLVVFVGLADFEGAFLVVGTAAGVATFADVANSRFLRMSIEGARESILGVQVDEKCNQATTTTTQQHRDN